MDVPAFCDSCAAVFRSGIVVEDSTNGSFAEDPAGPCPVCNSNGHIPDGLFKFVESTIEILSAPQLTLNELSRLAQTLYDAKGAKQSPEQLADAIRQEVPELASLAEVLPKTGSELYGFIALIAGVIYLLVQVNQDGDNPINVTLDQTLNRVFLETESAAIAAQTTPKLRRNEPCPCGSGKKYKRCCGRIQ